jgi:hypothetical protein
MIIRLSHKLGRKIGVQPMQTLLLHSNPFADWSAHLFTVERAQYIILTNTTSLYSVITFGRGITNDGEFIGRMTSVLGEFLRDDGLAFIWQRLISPETTSVRFSKSLNRSVTGSINEMIQCAKYLLINRDMSPFEVSNDLNEMPMSMIEHVVPRDEFISQTLD